MVKNHYVKETLNLKGLKLFEKKIFEIMDKYNLVYGDIYKVSYDDNEEIRWTSFTLDVVTEKGTSIVIRLEEYTDYLRKESNEYKYFLEVDTIKGHHNILSTMNPKGLLELLDLTVSIN